MRSSHSLFPLHLLILSGEKLLIVTCKFSPSNNFVRDLLIVSLTKSLNVISEDIGEY